MTLSISQLRERVVPESGFFAIEQIGDSIIRSTRRAGDLPFAVYYFDIGQKLPDTLTTLTKYQDQVIGHRYFEGKKSLQWNNYLYFLISPERFASNEVRKAKELIEQDRTYARKFVIVEDEIDAVVTPPVVTPTRPTPQINVLSVWTERLIEAGLDEAILGENDLPKRLHLIETATSRSTPRPMPATRLSQVKRPPFIRSLKLKTFRDYPRLPNLDFATVNLIFGSNASGKTSLLEAIELFYCGRNKRNPSASQPYELLAVLADGKTEKATNNRTLKLFRDRNLTWYGQPEIKTHNLYLRFAQFNFLDTDAAVDLARDDGSISRIEEDLSRLLVGPDASKIWHDIERVFEAVSSKLRELKPLKTQVIAELATLEKQLAESRSIPRKSDSIRERLDEMLRHIGWKTSGESEDFAKGLVGPLSELASLAQQASAIDWTDSPVSFDGLTDYSRETKAIIDDTEPDIARLEVLLGNLVSLAAANRNDLAALGIANEASLLIDRGMPKRLAQRSEDQLSLDRYSEWIAGFDENLITVLSGEHFEMTIVTCHETAVSKRSDLEASLMKVKEEHSRFVSLRDQAISLGQELRQIAQRIIEVSAEPDECPLCHTRFEPGELEKHLNVGVDKHLEATAQALLTELRKREGEVQRATAIEAASRWLKTFSEKAALAEDVSVRLVLAEVETARRTLEETRVRLEALSRELLAFESEGLSGMDLEEMSLRLRQFGYPLVELSRESLERAVTEIEHNLAISSKKLQTERDEANKLQQNLGTTLGSAEVGAPEFTFQDSKAAVSRMKEKITTTESLLSKLGRLFISFPWPGRKPLAELAVEAESVRDVAAELHATLGQEEQYLTTLSTSIARKGQLEQQREKLIGQIGRFERAHSTLKDLRREHSLTDAMKVALEQNRASIELIFSRIHSPAEFRGLGSTWRTLVRKADGSEAQLSEISTGQRAAFALSIFLAQNAQLSDAPPVVLIDDPIAHIDDLNSLSFLDYLREVVLTGQRQIFFATANDKLATLFERKFDFLGPDGFRRFNLPPHPFVANA
jgi:exonuclease SbcC